MKTNEYIIINLSKLKEMREQLSKGSAHWDGIYISDYQQGQIELIDTIISTNSIKLTTLLENAFDAGYDLNTWEQLKVPNEKRDYLHSEDYINNLKLNI